jgi:hypothetical protein
VRDRYVLQVLLVTLGFGVLLGLIAVVDAPKDWSAEPIAVSTPSDAPARSERIANQATPSYQMSPRVVDFADKADFPSPDTADETRFLPWQNCGKAGAAHKKAHHTGHHGPSADPTDCC